MTSFSMAHGLALVIFAVIFGVPLWRIVARTGLPGIMALLLFIPLLHVGMLWWLAYTRWPRASDRS